MKLFKRQPAGNPVIDNKQSALETLDEFFRIYHLVEAGRIKCYAAGAPYSTCIFIRGKEGRGYLLL